MVAGTNAKYATLKRVPDPGTATSPAYTAFLFFGIDHFDPTGRYAYVANYTDGTISGYSIAGNGALTALPRSPYSVSSTQPTDIGIVKVLQSN